MASPTAFVCASDSLALGALAATRPSGMATPEPGSAASAVVGFDDTPVARAVGLSSVAQPLTEVADRALALLLNQVDGPSATPLPGGTDHHVLLAPSLVVRDSSRARP
jgi:DNA-binding LacI/PurR family transcriptional regulator